MLSEEERKVWGEEMVVFPKGKPPEDYMALMEAGLQKAAETAAEGRYDVVVLDEINVALAFGLVSRASVENLLGKVLSGAEVICTGRKAPSWLIERADLVTDMREVKHYYRQGIPARRGIEN